MSHGRGDSSPKVHRPLRPDAVQNVLVGVSSASAERPQLEAGIDGPQRHLLEREGVYKPLLVVDTTTGHWVAGVI